MDQVDENEAICVNIMSDDNDFVIAEEYFNNEEYEEAFHLYKKLAKEGSVDSQVLLGWMYQNGLGINKDVDKAFSWYESAAKLGSAEGQFYLAKFYARKKDFSVAMDWYFKSAEKHYSPALFRLGWIFDVGRGVKRDKEKALNYYRRAANLGHVFSQKQLAILMIKGQLGFIARIHGLFLLLKSIVQGLLVAASDPHSEKLRD